MNEEQKKQNIPAAQAPENDNQIVAPVKKWQFKSWYISAFVTITLLIFGLLWIIVAVTDSRGEMPGLGFVIAIVLLVLASIALVSAMLLRSENHKKVGAIINIIFGIALGVFVLFVTLIDYGGSFDGLNSQLIVLSLISFLPSILLIFAGIYYFWKKN